MSIDIGVVENLISNRYNQLNMNIIRDNEKVIDTNGIKR
jgi:hypothetical protein